MKRNQRYLFTVCNPRTGHSMTSYSTNPRSAFTNWKKHWFQYGAEIPKHYFGFVIDMEKDLTVARLENGKFHMLTEKEIQEQLEERRQLCEPED